MDNRKDISKSQKDYYSSVAFCQLILCAVLVALVFFVRGEGVRNDFRTLMSSSMSSEDFSSLAYTLKSVFSPESSLRSVFGFEITESPEETTESLTEETAEETTIDEAPNNTTIYDEESTILASGGEDIPEAEVPSYCTFAPLKLTAPIMNPIENGRYTSYFGFRINPITGKYGFHTGLDIAAPEGTKIRAAFSGTVTKVSEDGRAGKYIFLTHDNGLVTFYCHCCEIVAEEGANIRQGETIALVGSTGWSTGNHLHFEVRKDNIRYDPLKLLSNAA